LRIFSEFWVGTRGFIILLVLSIIFTILVAPTSWNAYDINFFIEWVNVAEQYGLFNVYRYCSKVAYPPLPILIWIPMYKAGVSISNILYGYIDYSILRIITKIPIILFIYGIAYLIYRYFGKRPLGYFLLYYGVYAIIAGYQFDAIAVFGLLASYIFLVQNRPILTGVSCSLALLTKHALAAIFPYLLIVYWRRNGSKATIKFLLTIILFGSIIILPFFITDPSSFLSKVLIFHSQRYPQLLSIYAIPLYIVHYNYWLLPDFITWMWIIPYITIYIILLLLLSTSRCNRNCILLGYTSLIITMILLNKVGNTNYQLWYVPFLAIFISKYNSKFMKALYIILPIITIFLHDFMTLYSAAVVHGQYFITEDLRYYDAENLVLQSFKDAPIYGDIKLPLLISRTYFYNLHLVFYKNIWLTRLLLTIIYLSSLGYFQYKILKELKNRCSLDAGLLKRIMQRQ